MFVVLDGGIALPVPARLKTDPFTRPDDITDHRWKQDKQDRWLRAYTHCLYCLVNCLEEPIHTAVNTMTRGMNEVSDPHSIALRFLGEMRIAGWLKYKVKRAKKEGEWPERSIHATAKLAGTDFSKLDFKEGPVMPVLLGSELSDHIQIRRGVNSRANKRIVAVVNDIAQEKFTVNNYILWLLREFPPAVISDKGMYERTLETAEALKGEVFRFPYFLDSRGRDYVATTCGMTPQGADHEKALCLPTHSEVLTPDGVTALLEALSGYSEKDWSYVQHCAHAREPGKHFETWSQADKPYSYMALAKILSEYDEYPERPYAAFIPLDGRCSGLQHWSAVTRSRDITAHLGMELKEAALDIYEQIADQWRQSLPREMLQFATRKAAKIPVMTWAYNATRMTSMEHMRKLFGAESKWDKEESRYVVVEGSGLSAKETANLGCSLYKQANETLASLTTAVAWVSTCAHAITNEGHLSIHWITPDGFVATQRKTKGKKIEIDLFLSDGTRDTLEMMDFNTRTPDPRRAASALSPNVIHSGDATHLRLVAQDLHRLGLPMIFIHDSFATHVNHRKELYRSIVDRFIDMYQGDWLKTLHGYWQNKYGIDLPAPPPQGDWDPESLRDLPNFFL